MVEISNKTQNQKSRKFAAEIIGGNIFEETETQIAEEIQSTASRHLAKINQSVYTKSTGNQSLINNPVLWRDQIAIFADIAGNSTMKVLDNVKVY
jgi:hypothetical protein